ncbi:protein SCO1 [Gammaproteobacteria bacterium]
MSDSEDSGSGGIGFFRYGVFIVGAISTIFAMWFGMDYLEQGLKPNVVTLKSGTYLSQPKPLQPFFLTSQDGKPFTRDNLLGHWTFLAIGYTACPDVCPTLMATFSAVARQITPSGAKPATDFLFVSVDPERDTPQHLAEYVHYFNPDFRGATGSDNALQVFVRQFGLLYQRVAVPGSALGYVIDHSSSILLIDPEARFSAVFSAPHDPQAIAADFARLVPH